MIDGKLLERLHVIGQRDDIGLGPSARNLVGKAIKFLQPRANQRIGVGHFIKMGTQVLLEKTTEIEGSGEDLIGCPHWQYAVRID